MQASGKSSSAPSISRYFRDEWKVLAVVTVTGILYNVGLVAGPWLEGLLAQCLADIFQGLADAGAMIRLAAIYVFVICFVQGMRALKRLYVRKFANNVNRRMKRTLYANLLCGGGAGSSRADVGDVMTRAVADVDDCVEGMRKFTTELFDTGVVMAAYIVVLLAQDWRIALLALIFPPISYVLAAWLRKPVTGAVTSAKKEISAMAGMALDRVEGALTYRIFGLEARRDELFEEDLARYERAETKANVLSSSLMPLYQALALVGIFPIFIFGAQNVVSGIWDIAAFTMYVSIFCRLAQKSSHAAKLFNAVQRAQVSWKRIEPYMGTIEEPGAAAAQAATGLAVSHLTFGWPGAEPLFEDVSFTVAPGEIVGVTGAVACGKTTLGRAILGEIPAEGSVVPSGPGIFSALGHDPELLDASIRDNIALGEEADIGEALALACLEDDVEGFPDRADTLVGEAGERLSGGQRQRLGLARTLYHVRPAVVLDDTFSALDARTEQEAFAHLAAWTKEHGAAVVLISHRLSFFPELDQIVCLHDRKASVGTHTELMESCPAYRELFLLQGKEGSQCAE